MKKTFLLASTLHLTKINTKGTREKTDFLFAHKTSQWPNPPKDARERKQIFLAWFSLQKPKLNKPKQQREFCVVFVNLLGQIPTNQWSKAFKSFQGAKPIATSHSKGQMAFQA